MAAIGDISDELAGVVRTLLSKRANAVEALDCMDIDRGIDGQLWRALMAEMELGQVMVSALKDSEEAWPSLAAVQKELGASLVAVPYLSSIVFALPLLDDGEPHTQQWVDDVAAGRRRAALAITGPAGGWPGWGDGVMASGRVGDWRLTGSKSWVVDGNGADLLVVAASVEDGSLGLFVVDTAESTDDSLTVTTLETLDPTRPMAEVNLDGAVAYRLAGDAEQRLWDRLPAMWTALAAEQLGGAAKALDITVGYAKERIQFGRPIGSFQAVKHRLADMAVLVENMSAGVWRAVQALGDGTEPDLLALTAAVRSYCSEAYVEITNHMIQLHGGIGFTWEHPAHLYFKRARTSAVLLGDSSSARQLAHAAPN